MATKRASKRSTTRRSNVKRVLNCVPSENTEKDWTPDEAKAAGALRAGRAAAAPASIDLRTGNSWYKIGDQGATGSCVGWASADSVVRWHFVKANRLASTKSLSVRYVWMASKETDQFTQRPSTFIDAEGTSLKSALDVCRKWGTVEDTLLPFASGKLYPGTEGEFYAIAATGRISAYFNLGTNPTAWKNWLSQNGPILTRLGVDATWDGATGTNGNLDVYQPQTNRGGHAVALVGYTPDRFIVRNSWGTAWGDKGYAYASYGYAQAAFTEAYGVTP